MIEFKYFCSKKHSKIPLRLMICAFWYMYFYSFFKLAEFVRARGGDWEWEGGRVKFLIKSSTTIAKTEAATMWLN